MEQGTMLEQILSAMQEQTEVLTKMMDQKMDEKISAAETRINLKIENEISRKIEALFDGYKLTHEKQWELERWFERRSEQMQGQIDDLQARIAALENKSA